MTTTVVVSAVVLFGIMFLPLPAPISLASVLWAMAAGVPLSAVLGLYLAQDVISYVAIRRLLPTLAPRCTGITRLLHARAPRLMRGLTRSGLRSAGGGGTGLFSAAFASFYAGAALAALQNGAALRSAVLVIAADLLKYLNGLALALGASHALPSSMWTTVAASLLGLAAVPLFRAVSSAIRPRVAPEPIRLN